MLSCAQRLARSRAQGLLWTQPSVCSNYWPRSLQTSRKADKVYASTTTLSNQDLNVENQQFVTDRSQSNSYHTRRKGTVPTEGRDGGTNNGREVKTTKTNSGKRASGQRNSTSSTQRGTENSGDAAIRFISNTSARKTIHAQGASPKLAHSVTRRLNAELRARKRRLNKRSLYLATVIGSNSLYSRGLGLRQWRAAFKEIYTAKRYEREIQNTRVIPALGDSGKELLEKARSDCFGSFREAWQALHRTDKALHWQRLAIWLMQNDLKSFPEFLIVTTSCKEKPNFTIVFDCFRYLDNHYYADWLKDWRSGDYTYQSLIEECLDPRDWPIVSVNQKGPRLFIRRAGHEAVSSALRLVKERCTQINPETALCFMWRFTELGDVDRALESLKFIAHNKDNGLNMNSDEVMRHCCKLLTLDTVKDDGANGRNFRILPQLLKIGVRPDRDMMNVVLSNAYKTGDPQLGTDILEFMKNHDHTFDSYTYNTLLGDAVSRGERARVDSLIHEIAKEEDLRTNPYLTSKIFHSHYIFTTKHMDEEADPSSVFYAMLDMYNQLHDITPLKELLIIPPHYTPGEGSKLPPSPIALYIMIATYFRCQKRFSNVQRIYTQFRHLVAQGHPLISPLATTDHTYNEFLIALRDNPRGLRSCVRLVEDMLHSSSSKSKVGKSIDHVKPSMRTWTILLSAFTFNRQPRAAQKIKEMMAKHNVKYNAVTWNVIINGYANAQNIPQTAASIKAMEQQGFAIDPYTMRSLRYLRDPERLWVAMDELDEAATAQDSQSTIPVNESETNSEPVLSNEEQREKELDEGLGKLGNKMKSKL